ncbi:DNA-binding GntR family transcriptional regulator [Rhizobium aethiopicum]|uniref:DNA-binding GntR family transcriptional regulator n=1 Tax=Rhizobium aethiopicum TaxID=1138170 RepID=A0A7W6Q8X4_9HYPH|nr:GntR family transcriptional regulator [Rhizobium aethiopicum]MBB4192978.1 DNA-binding GntR family transcriptional regulator [Rhizobium aethiopicum]MBB4584089.1 DNA-binding GntR family transcriptional regulator [Rhizobium aethiopicum]
MNENTTGEESPPSEQQSGRLSDFAYSSIKEQLVRGAYKPGHKLPIRSVAEMLHIGATPAREAINRLVLEGALVMAGPKTVIVPHLDLPALYEVTQMRIALEGLATEKGALRATNDTINKLLELQGKITSALDDGRYSDALHENKEFHFTIYRLCEMPHLFSTIEALWLRVGASFHDLYPEFAEVKYGVRNHMAAIEGLVDKDPSAVRAAMENDIRDGFRRLKKAAQERLKR